MAKSGSWRVSDAVAYDLMRADAAALCRLLILDAQTDAQDPKDAALELVKVRHEALAMDGYDRRAVDTLADRFRARARELSGVTSA